ncbi:MAG: dephospho-CoA kinase [Bacteroidales bacterium]|nr:dephospho-CoA kinase [Bacteroidales bacterium]
MLKVGITGNLGSGKSLVCSIFSALSVPVFNADSEAKALYHDPHIKNEVISYFGKDVFCSTGDLNATILADKIFKDEQAMEFISGLIHPAVRDRFSQWCLQHNQAPYVLYEAAIMIESGHYRMLDKLILVTAPLSLRIQRVMARDHATEASVCSRVDKQMPEADKIPFADFMVNNDGETLLIPQVLSIHKALVSISD